MKKTFPAHFRPSVDELQKLWTEAIFAVDANVLLNLYRYSKETREELEQALTSVEKSLHISHQAAAEYLKNRINVTASQAEEYTKAVETLGRLTDRLVDQKQHPFVSDGALPEFEKTVSALTAELKERKETLLGRLVDDERLSFVEKLFDGKTGSAFSSEELDSIFKNGEDRYKKQIPPGFKDSSKSSDSDPNAKFGDLVMWKQLIEYAKKKKTPLILITDDSKEDWWLRQSGRTIGPRFELRDEFLRETKSDFWMYSVELFLENSAKARNQTVSHEVIAEVQEVSSLAKTRFLSQPSNYYKDISEQEMVERLRSSERWAQNHEGFIGLHTFVTSYLGSYGYDYANSYDVIESLVSKGIAEVYEHKGAGHERPVRAVRLIQGELVGDQPLSGLKEMMEDTKES